jgi:NDP-sugar pyrophosphorylase family protein
VNTGIYIFSPQIFRHIPAGEFYDFGKDVFPALQQAGEAFYGYDAGDAYWCDIGTIDEYWRATVDVLRGRFHIPGTVATGIDESAVISPEARIVGAVLIGPQTVVEAAATIVGPSVISQGVRIGAGARVEESVLWEGAQVGEGAQVRRTIAGIKYRIPPQARLNGEVVANEEPAPVG